MLENLSTAHLADGCLRIGVQQRCVTLATVTLGTRLAGPARVVRHYGSVDIFLETIEAAAPGDVMVVDNAGRRDESCVGDLVAIEVKHAGLAGIVIWGCHRDTAEIRMQLMRMAVTALPRPLEGQLRKRAMRAVLRRVRPTRWIVGPENNFRFRCQSRNLLLWHHRHR